MKLITAIINNADVSGVAAALSENKFHFTAMESTGGYLKMENTTMLIGVDDDKADEVIAIIKEKSSRRMKLTSNKRPAAGPSNISFGGATVFVTDIERFEKF